MLLQAKRRSSDSLVNDIKTKSFSCLKKVGSGVVGTTYSGYSKGGKALVVKVIRIDDNTDSIHREIICLNTIRKAGGCDYIANYFSCFKVQNDYKLFFDRYDMDLVQFVNSVNDHTRIKLLGVFMKSISKALSYLHFHGIWHMDVKPDNILVNTTLTNLLEGNKKPVTFYLTDFSHSTFRKAEKFKYKFTPIISPPEEYFSFLNKPLNMYNEKSDIWCFGITCYYFMTGKFLYSEAHNSDCKINIPHVIVSLGDTYDIFTTRGKVNIFKHTPGRLINNGRTVRLISKIERCLFYRSKYRHLPYNIYNVLSSMLVTVNTLKYGLTTKDKQKRIEIINYVDDYIGYSELDKILFTCFVYNYDTVLIETGFSKYLLKACIVLDLLLLVLTNKNDKKRETFIEQIFGECLSDELLCSDIVELITLPEIIFREYLHPLDVSEDFLYRIK